MCKTVGVGIRIIHRSCVLAFSQAYVLLVISNEKNIYMTLNKHKWKHCCFTILTLKMHIQLFLNHLIKVVLKGLCTFTNTVFSNLRNKCSYTCYLRHLTEILAEVISSIFYVPIYHHWLHRSLGYLLYESPNSLSYLP